jgi:adenylylsulfate kinase
MLFYRVPANKIQNVICRDSRKNTAMKSKTACNNNPGAPAGNDAVVWHTARVAREDRAHLNRHRSAVVWFTGLPSSGKSTIAHGVEEKLFRAGCRTFVLDGDNVRHGLCSDLGFSPDDRAENMRRIAEVARLFLEAGVLVLAAFISPLRADRERARQLFSGNDFLEISCDCPLEVCEQRDPKGNYRRAREGLITQFTGISAPYETPVECDLVLNTARYSSDECAEQVIQLLREHGIVL